MKTKPASVAQPQPIQPAQLDDVVGGCACGCGMANCSCTNGSCQTGSTASSHRFLFRSFRR